MEKNLALFITVQNVSISYHREGFDCRRSWDCVRLCIHSATSISTENTKKSRWPAIAAWRQHEGVCRQAVDDDKTQQKTARNFVSPSFETSTILSSMSFQNHINLQGILPNFSDFFDIMGFSAIPIFSRTPKSRFLGGQNDEIWVGRKEGEEEGRFEVNFG